jgi:hypothetical protein
VVSTATAISSFVSRFIFALQRIVNQLLFDKLQHTDHGGHVQGLVVLVNLVKQIINQMLRHCALVQVHFLLLASRHACLTSNATSGENSTIEQSIFFASVMVGNIHAQNEMNKTNVTTIKMLVAISNIVFSSSGISTSEQLFEVVVQLTRLVCGHVLEQFLR